MSDSSVPTPPPSKKTLNLDDLKSAKTPVETTCGTLFVRDAYVSDWKHFESDDAVELGRSAIRQLCNRVEDKSVSDPLADADLGVLTEADIELLAPAIAKRCGWDDLSLAAGLQGLGALVKKAKERERDLHAASLEKLVQSITNGYSFLGGKTLEKFTQQVAGVAAIRNKLAALDSLTAVRNSAATPAVDALLARSNEQQSLSRFVPQRPENTPIGRATLESAKASRDVAQKMDGLVELVSGLNQTLITEVLPAWIRQVEGNQTHAQESLDKAAKSLVWAKWALIASVVASVVSIVMAVALTWWQIGVTRAIDEESSTQQKRSEELLRDQLAVQKQLVDQQARNDGQLQGRLQQLQRDAEEDRKMLRELQSAPASKK